MREASSIDVMHPDGSDVIYRSEWENIKSIVIYDGDAFVVYSDGEIEQFPNHRLYRITWDLEKEVSE